MSTCVFKNVLGHIDGWTEVVISSVNSIDTIVGSDGSVAASGPLHSTCLRAGSGWIRIRILFSRTAEVRESACEGGVDTHK